MTNFVRAIYLFLMGLLIGAILAFIFVPPIHAEENTAMRKTLHVALSAGLGIVADTALFKSYEDMAPWKRIALATVIGTLPGIYKEEYDRQKAHEKYSSRVRDIALDAAGAFLGAWYADRENRLSVSVGSELRISWRF